MKKIEHNQSAPSRFSDDADIFERGRWHYDIDADRVLVGRGWYRIMGLSEASPITGIEDIARLVHPDDLEAATRIDPVALEHVGEGTMRYATAFRIIRDDGAIREIRSVARLYRDPATGHRCAIGFVIDVTPGAALPSISREAEDATSPDDEEAPITALTEGERECLAWAGHGKTAWETAQIMGLSPRTVEFHVANAIAKLRAANKVHAAAIAVRLGLI